MHDSVRIEIEVTPEAASLLRDETRRRSIGRMVSELVGRKQLDQHPLRRLFAESSGTPAPAASPTRKSTLS